VLEPMRVQIAHAIEKINQGRISETLRIETALEEIEKERDNSIRGLVAVRKAALAAAEQMQSTLRVAVQEEFATARRGMEELVGNFVLRSAEMPSTLDLERGDAERRLAELYRTEYAVFHSIQRQMNDLTDGINARETTDDRFAALELRNQQMDEQLDFYADFAQMGMAVGILQHEFEHAASGIRMALGELKPWAERNPPLLDVYRRLRSHIEHLDGYLKAIDPLGRRMHRATVMISGDEILTAVRRVFSHMLDERKIKFVPSHEFRSFSIEGKSASLIGAFVNVIDNAIYWIDSRTEGEREIYLDCDEVGFLISNSGPGIAERMRNQIFEFGVSNKPGGRGMGLSVSREALRRDGFELELLNAGQKSRPTFRISNKNTESEKC
jgi:signal transduction histidine kinase